MKSIFDWWCFTMAKSAIFELPCCNSTNNDNIINETFIAWWIVLGSICKGAFMMEIIPAVSPLAIREGQKGRKTDWIRPATLSTGPSKLQWVIIIVLWHHHWWYCLCLPQSDDITSPRPSFIIFLSYDIACKKITSYFEHCYPFLYDYIILKRINSFRIDSLEWKIVLLYFWHGQGQEGLCLYCKWYLAWHIQTYHSIFDFMSLFNIWCCDCSICCWRANSWWLRSL